MRFRVACILFSFVALATTIPAFAEEESAAEICQAEAQDVGIEDPEELKEYIADCIEQVQEEMKEMKKEQHGGHDMSGHDMKGGKK